MSYVVLARKYRPQQFQDLVGQIPVSQTLVNALESGRIAHAYVFSGPRGIGKTTTARLLAKCLNCAKGTTINPCNECPSCMAISQGTSMQDVLEIDGASNRGIEQIRELRETAKYAPTSSRYRIFIIDEAHQITKDAFGALLKTLEEPPAHVVFMMATTEVQKIPAPILSRCQRFSLRPISAELVLNHLQDICKKEKIKIEDGALADIVRFVEGSMRDALSLLDQAIVFSPEAITTSTLRELLGLLPLDVIRTFAATIKDGEPGAILKNVNESIQNGVDLTQLAKNLQDHYHSLLLAKAGVEDPLNPEAQKMAAEAKAYDYYALERSIRLLSKALEEMRRSESPRAVFEVYALKLGQKTLDARQLIDRVEKLERSRPVSNPAPAASFSRPTAPIAPPTSYKSAAPVASSQASASVPDPQNAPLSSPAKVSPSGSSSDRRPVKDGWTDFIELVGQKKQSLASALEEATVEATDERVVLAFDKVFNQQLVARSNDVLLPLFLQHFGFTPILETKVVAGLARADKSAEPARPLPEAPPALEAEASLEEISADEADSDTKRVLKHFPGTLKREKKS